MRPESGFTETASGNPLRVRKPKHRATWSKCETTFSENRHQTTDSRQIGALRIQRQIGTTGQRSISRENLKTSLGVCMNWPIQRLRRAIPFRSRLTTSILYSSPTQILPLERSRTRIQTGQI